MNRIARPLLVAASLMSAPYALAQQVATGPTIEAGHAVLTVSAEGRSTRQPDLAVFNAGVTTQGKTAAEALAANSASMNRVIAQLKRSGIAERDIQTSNLSINPVYAEQRPAAAGEYQAPVIVAYQVNNSVSVRQRKLGDYGKVIDTLVTAGANQVNGPSFQLDQPDTALDEARSAAMRTARARANLYAQAAGLRVLRILTISEGGSYTPMPQVMYRMAASADMAGAPPVQSGELQLNANVSVTFELAPL